MPTNTVTGVFGLMTGNFATSYDALVVIAAITVGIAIVFGLVRRWLPARHGKAG